MKVEFFTPSTFGDCDIRPDKYIRSIIKTSDGSIWSGGYYNLKQIDFNRKIYVLIRDLAELRILRRRMCNTCG